MGEPTAPRIDDADVLIRKVVATGSLLPIPYETPVVKKRLLLDSGGARP